MEDVARDDCWGNVTTRFFSGTTATLSYDALDHFTEWNAGSNNHEWYIYDGSGERLVRRSTTGSGTTLTTYPFGDEHRYDSTGAALDSTYYLTLAGRLIGTVTGSDTLTTQYLLEDALGSPLAAFSNADGTTNVLGSALYGPYGNQRAAAGSLGTAKGFTGQYNDSQTGLDYYHARFYDPKAGVFLSADTAQGNAQGMNPYGYVGGNPETRTDPTGERPVPGDGYIASIPAPTPTPTPTPTPPTSTTNSGNKCPGDCLQKAWEHDAEKVRSEKLALLNKSAIWKLVGGYFLLLVGDVYNFLNGGDVVEKIEAFIDFASSFVTGFLPSLGEALGFSGFYQVAMKFSALMMKGLAIAQGVIALIKGADFWAANMAKISANLLFAALSGPVGIFMQGLTDLVKPVLGHLLDMGGHALLASGFDDLAEEARQNNMSLDDWCTQYKGCPAKYTSS